MLLFCHGSAESLEVSMQFKNVRTKDNSDNNPVKAGGNNLVFLKASQLDIAKLRSCFSRIVEEA